MPKFKDNFLVLRAVRAIIVSQWIENDERANQICGFPVEHRWVALYFKFINTVQYIKF